jgi:hypothetical protein
MLCLVIEYPGQQDDQDFPGFTQRNRGASVDILIEPGSGESRQALVLVRGAPWGAMQELVAELQRTRAPVQTLRADPAEEMWFGRITYEARSLDQPIAKAFGRIQSMHGPPWVHVEAGVVHLRAVLRDARHAEDVLQLAQEGLRAAGADVQAIIQEVAPKDHSVWESLVRHGIGMSL